MSFVPAIGAVHHLRHSPFAPFKRQGGRQVLINRRQMSSCTLELVAARKDEAGFTNRNPLFLPDGKHILYTARGGKDPVAAVYAEALDGSAPKQILPAGSNVAYSDGYLFYLKEGTLTAQRFDAAALRVEGNPTSLAANVEYWNPRDLGSFSVSHNRLAYRTSAPLTVTRAPGHCRHISG